MGHPRKTPKLPYYPLGHRTPDNDRIFDGEEREFMQAMHAMKIRLGKPGPGPSKEEQDRWWAEVLREAKRLGYRKSRA